MISHYSMKENYWNQLNIKIDIIWILNIPSHKFDFYYRRITIFNSLNIEMKKTASSGSLTQFTGFSKFLEYISNFLI